MQATYDEITTHTLTLKLTEAEVRIMKLLSSLDVSIPDLLTRRSSDMTTKEAVAFLNTIRLALSPEEK